MQSRNLEAIFFSIARVQDQVLLLWRFPSSRRDAFTPSESLTRSLFPRGRTGVGPQYLGELGEGFNTIIPRGRREEGTL